jgi:hypothetical protein
VKDFMEAVEALSAEIGREEGFATLEMLRLNDVIIRELRRFRGEGWRMVSIDKETLEEDLILWPDGSITEATE